MMRRVLEALESGEPFELLCEAIVESACGLRNVQMAALDLAPDARQSPMREVARCTKPGLRTVHVSSLNRFDYPTRRFGVVIGRLMLWSPAPLGKSVREKAELHAFWGGVAFERGRAGVQLQALLERLQILNELNQLIISDIPFDRLATGIAREAAYRFTADIALTLLIDKGDEEHALKIIGAYGCPATALEQTLSSKEGFLGQLVSFGGQATASDIASLTNDPLQWLTEFGIKTVHGGCLDHHHDSYGLVLLGFTRDRTLTVPEEERYDEFCRAAAVAILNAQNRDQLLSYSERLEDLVEQRTADLEVESRRAQEASRAKSRFLANMSHELRTPLTSIIGFTSILTDEIYGPLNEKQNEALNAIAKSSDHLKHLINDILDLARIESGKETANPSSVDVGHLLSHTFRLMQQTAAEKQIHLSTEVEGPNLFTFADQKHVQQILINLVGNAIKYTKPGGSVRVVARSVGRMVSFRVQDTGVGMPPELIHTLFDRFSRGDDEYSRQQEGTGIGLSIVHQLVELNEGIMEVESEVGKGTIFVVNLPASEPPLVLNDKKDKIDPKQVSLQGTNILVLEDDLQARRILKSLLEARGAQVILSESIASAVPHFEHDSINLIITDIGLYKESGLGFIELVRRQSSDIPIIVLSGSAFEEDRQRALEAGANDFVSKPFDIRALLAVTTRLLRIPSEGAQ